MEVMQILRINHIQPTILYQILLLIVLSIDTNAQNNPPCATNHVMHLEQLNDLYIPNNQTNKGQPYATPSNGYRIKVIFHVVEPQYKKYLKEGCQPLIETLNKHFSADTDITQNLRTHLGFTAANSHIQFEAATEDQQGILLREKGVYRILTNQTVFSYPRDYNRMFFSAPTGAGTAIWDRNEYLNIYIVDLNGQNTQNLLRGYTRQPSTNKLPPANIDGIVLDYRFAIADATVLTHEIGHWLGLSHTWGTNGTTNGCTNDDGISDTPNTAGPSSQSNNSCSGTQQSCAGIEVQYENFMDYSECQMMFTQGQVNRMHAILNGPRKSLLNQSVLAKSKEIPPPSIQVFPNPSNGPVNLNLYFYTPQDITISIQSILGKKILVQKYTAVQKEQIKLSLKNCTSGIYILTIQYQNKVITHKIKHQN